MCARYTLHSSIERLLDKFALENVIKISPTYNCAPGAFMPIIVQNRIGLAKWGLIPKWAKDKRKTGIHNARIETAAEKPLFREAWQQRRCLVPANGFYEWQDTPTGKQPVYFHYGDEPFAFAGLWEKADGQVTYTILTQSASDPVLAVHQRMPVILPATAYAAWLSQQEDITSASQHCMGEIQQKLVNRAVNNSRNDSPALTQ